MSILTEKATNFVIPFDALRQAQIDNKEFLSLEQSIGEYGYLTPVLCRYGKDGEKMSVYAGIKTDEKTGKEIQYSEEIDVSGKLVVINGVQRVTAGKRLGNLDVPYIIDESDGKYMEKSIISNINVVKTKKSDIAKQIKNWISEGYSLSEISKKLVREENWVINMLSLNSLLQVDGMSEKLNNGDLSLANAFLLVKEIPHCQDATEKQNLIDQACTENAETFKKTCALRKDSRKINSRLSSHDIENEVYEHTESFNRDRLNEEKAKLEQIEESAILDGEELSARDNAVLEFIRYIHNSSNADVERAQSVWEQERQERLTKAKMREDKEIKKAVKDN